MYMVFVCAEHLDLKLVAFLDFQADAQYLMRVISETTSGVNKARRYLTVKTR
ncbi:MAG: hypothetical protein M3Y13_15305 [Armatimonadota bacterium]|nr:hypothetical protein [Armatimonadota bacterium]